jgi:rhamnosyl/mannosyltransferase
VKPSSETNREPRLRILHVGKFYPPHMGGTEIYTQELVRRHSKTAEIDVLVTGDSRRTTVESVDGVRLTRLSCLGIVQSMPVTPELPLAISKRPADIIHMHMPNPAASLSYLLSGHKGKLILTHHADTVGRKMLRKISDPVVNESMRRASRIITTSQRYLETSTDLAAFRSKCTVVPLGIDLAKFTQNHDPEVHEIRAKYGQRLLICVGRLVEFKGYHFAIQALRNIDAALLIVGVGPMEQALRDLAVQCGVAARVHFLGSMPNERIPALLKASEIVLFTSTRRTESFGYVQLEAMAAGIPVINTSIDSGAAEVSVHGVTGLTVPPKDSAALSDAIRQLLDNDELRRKFGAAGSLRVMENFTADVMAERTMEIYLEALYGKSAVPAHNHLELQPTLADVD